MSDILLWLNSTHTLTFTGWQWWLIIGAELIELGIIFLFAVMLILNKIFSNHS